MWLRPSLHRLNSDVISARRHVCVCRVCGFAYAEPSLHPGGKPRLVMVYDVLHGFLNLDYRYFFFIENF